MLTSICGSRLASANGILIQARSLDGSRAAGCRPCSAVPLDALPVVLPSRARAGRPLVAGAASPSGRDRAAPGGRVICRPSSRCSPSRRAASPARPRAPLRLSHVCTLPPCLICYRVPLAAPAVSCELTAQCKSAQTCYNRPRRAYRLAELRKMRGVVTI